MRRFVQTEQFRLPIQGSPAPEQPEGQTKQAERQKTEKALEEGEKDHQYLGISRRTNLLRRGLFPLSASSPSILETNSAGAPLQSS